MSHPSQHPNVNRREFLIRSGGIGIVLAGSALYGSTISCMKTDLPRTVTCTDFDAALAELEKLERAKGAQVQGDWTIPQVLSHLAQSIEYSMTGFPKLRGVIIRKAIGPMVFRKFKGQGHMSHNLNEAIPGAPDLSREESFEVGLARLRKAIADFRAFKGDLRPHFAYGQLSRPDTELAHSMHIANHLSAMTLS